MAGTLPVVDVDESPELRRLVDEIRACQAPVILRLDGEEVAVVSPPAAREDGEASRGLTDYEREAFRRTAGGWTGYIDVDEFLEETYASRRLPPRPPVVLE